MRSLNKPKSSFKNELLIVQISWQQEVERVVQRQTGTQRTLIMIQVMMAHLVNVNKNSMVCNTDVNLLLYKRTHSIDILKPMWLI